MKVKDYVLVALLAGILFISKEILAFLPSVELVSFLVIIYTRSLGLKKTILITFIFAALETLVYGIGVWTIMYVILWSLLSILTHLLSSYLTTELKLALFSGAFGLSFGFLYEIPYFIIDFKLGLGVWIQGIPFDLIHCICNYIVILCLYEPVYPRFKQLVTKFQ